MKTAKKFRRLMFGLMLAGVAILAAAGFAWQRATATSWPELPAVPDGAAQMLVEVEPGFAWRTGDIVPVVIYVAVDSHTSCDTRSLVVKGDMRLRSFSVVSEERLGKRYFKFSLQLQAFEWKQPWLVKPFVACQKDGERKQLSLPELEVSTSKTFDDKKEDKHPKDPPLTYLASYDWLEKLCVGFAALACLAACVWVIIARFKAARAARQPVTLPEWTDMLAVMLAAVRAMKEGADQTEHCKLVDNTMRRCYGAESVPFCKLQEAAFGPVPDFMSLTLVLGFCQQVVYAQQALSPEDLDKLEDLVQECAGASRKLSPDTAKALLDRPQLPPVKRSRWLLWTVIALVVLGLAAVGGFAAWSAWMDAQVPVMG